MDPSGQSLVQRPPQIKLRIQADAPQGCPLGYDRPTQAQIGVHAQSFKAGRFLPGHGNSQPGAFVDGQGIDQSPLKKYFAGCRCIAATTHDEVGEGGLAGAACTEQGVDLLLCHRQVKTSQRLLVLHRLRQAFNLRQNHALYSNSDPRQAARQINRSTRSFFIYRLFPGTAGSPE
jgi:hypothetical protein